MIGWYTDNLLSRTVMDSIESAEVRHIKEFHPHNCPHVFYGILRGCDKAMCRLAYMNIDYYYIDNGYFDAMYVGKDMRKSMLGKFRVVKNGMHDAYPHEATKSTSPRFRNLLIVPPSPYSANFYDTTPEDWLAWAAQFAKDNGWEIKIRHKTELRPLEADLDWCTAVLSFNSMIVMRAIELGKVVCDTHGILKNASKLNQFPVYDIQSMLDYYEPKQFTLEEFRQGKCTWI